MVSSRNRIAVATWHKEVEIYDVHLSGQLYLVGKIKGWSRVQDLELSHNGQWLIVKDFDCKREDLNVFLYRIENRNLEKISFFPLTHGISNAVFIQNDLLAISYSYDNYELNIFEMKNELNEIRVKQLLSYTSTVFKRKEINLKNVFALKGLYNKQYLKVYAALTWKNGRDSYQKIVCLTFLLNSMELKEVTEKCCSYPILSIKSNDNNVFLVFGTARNDECSTDLFTIKTGQMYLPIESNFAAFKYIVHMIDPILFRSVKTFTVKMHRHQMINIEDRKDLREFVALYEDKLHIDNDIITCQTRNMSSSPMRNSRNIDGNSITMLMHSLHHDISKKFVIFSDIMSFTYTAQKYIINDFHGLSTFGHDISPAANVRRFFLRF